ncbi:MAG: hypothetical protein GF344_12975, partial [Chitinivibrionales bacterium]|nr:hypothetical protein [Chitinivibrionales bacterium]MBD3357647.1 hypothetical protein [Chitinivibrionales bacterium]
MRFLRSIRRRMEAAKKAAEKSKKFRVEQLEPRLLFDAQPFMVNAASPFDMTLRYNEAAQEVQLIDNLVGANEPAVVASQALADTSKVIIEGSEGADSLTIDYSSAFALPEGISFSDDTPDDGDSLAIVGAPGVWEISGADEGTFNGDLHFSGIENITGAADYDDTFVVGNGGSISGVLDGGRAGFDTLEVSSDAVTGIKLTATDHQSGTVEIDGTTTNYAGLEPIVINAAVSNLVVDGSAGDDTITVTSGIGGDITVQSPGTMESVVINTLPTDTLTIDAGDGEDSVTISGDIDIPGVNLSVYAESITVDTGSAVSTATGTGEFGDIELLAADTADSWSANAESALVINDATLIGGNIALGAVSTITSNSTGLTVFSELDAGLIIARSSARVSIQGVSSISGHADADGTGDVSVGSESAVSTNLSVVSRTTGSLGTDVAAAGTVAESSSIAEVVGSSAISAEGDVAIDASNTVTVATTTDGTAGGSDVPLGVGIGFSWVNQTTKAYLADMSTITDASSVTISAGSNDDVNTLVSATPNGAAPSAETAQALLDNLIATANSQITAFNALFGVGIPTIPAVTLPTLPAGDVSVAAALGLGRLDGTTEAYVSSSNGVSATGDVLIEALSDADCITIADAGTVDGSLISDEIGVAVALNFSDVVTTAYVAGAPDFTVGSLNIRAGMASGAGPAAPDGVHTSGVSATSGAGASTTGVAGAFAYNDVDTTTRALVNSGATVSLLGGATDVTLESAGVSGAFAEAKPETLGGSSTDKGVGAAFALNLVDTEVAAEIQSAASLNGARNLMLGADSNDGVTTTAVAGAEGGTATAPAVALTYATNVTRAALNAGALLSLNGALFAEASQVGATLTRATGDTVGSSNATGPTLAFNITENEVYAGSFRDVSSAGVVRFSAIADRLSEAYAHAGAAGAHPADRSGDQLIADHQSFLNSTFSLPLPGTVPSMATPDDPAGSAVAAALAINLDSSDAKAHIESGAGVASDNMVSVSASGDFDAAAHSDSVATAKNPGMGAAVALNSASPVTQAFIGGTVSAPQIEVQTSMAGDGESTSSAHAASGAGAAGTGVGGSLAINVANVKSLARIGSAATVTLTGALKECTFRAVNESESVADASAAGSGTTGVGASLAINVVTTLTRAQIENGAAVNGANDLTLEADGTGAVLTTGSAGAEGGTSIAPAVAFTYVSDTTEALLGSGSTLALSGALVVNAKQTGSLESRAAGNAVGASSIIGPSLAFSITDNVAEANVARDLDAAGAVSIEAESDRTSKTHARAGAAGAASSDITADNLISEYENYLSSRFSVSNPATIPSTATPYN